MSDDCLFGRPAGTLAYDDCRRCRGSGFVPCGPSILHGEGLRETPMRRCEACGGTGTREDEDGLN